MSNKNFSKYGRSGCSFILNEENMLLRKISKNTEYNNRLYKQYLKQKKFTDYVFFSKPIVYDFDINSDLHFFEMQYIRGNTFDKFCKESSVDEIVGFCNSLIEFISFNLDNSILTKIDFFDLNVKLSKMKKNLEFEYHIYIDFLLQNPINEVLVGKSHGDLTMSNIIFSDKYYFIDFLDNEFESPLNDLAKIKQDTEHNFYLSLSKDFNSKIKICLDYLDKRINTKFKNEINSFQFTWISIFNLLRVINYLDSESEINTIKKGLKKYEYFITNCR